MSKASDIDVSNIVLTPDVLCSDNLDKLQEKIDNRGKFVIPYANNAPVKLKVSEISDMIRTYEGNLSEIAEVMMIPRHELRKFVSANKELKLVMSDQRELKVDIAESSVMLAAKNGNFTAAKFILNTIGSDRGYIEKREVKHDGVIHLGLDQGDMDL